ncbi:MAG: ester cyclase [Silicimonas sp.]|nr:ester cyclase [Silicimonas sp.]
MPTPEQLIHRFYREIWDHADEDVAREILSPHLRFRGSLGPEKTGAEGFIEYLRAIHTAFGNFESIIETLLVSGQSAAAKMRFGGIQQAEIFGVPATHTRIEWSAAAFFETDGTQITSLWLIGDVDHVKTQLGREAKAAFD